MTLLQPAEKPREELFVFVSKFLRLSAQKCVFVLMLRESVKVTNGVNQMSNQNY